MLIVGTGNPQLLDLCSVDNAIDFPNTYLLDSDLTGG